jgi:hypothetical protein
MSNINADKDGRSFPHDPAVRGYCIVYHEDEVNHCPGCGRTHWYVGRVSAECGFCGTALQLASATARGSGTYSRNARPSILEEAA